MLFSHVIDSMMGLLICKYEPFWQEVSAISDTQVAVKVFGPLVDQYLYFEMFYTYWTNSANIW